MCARMLSVLVVLGVMVPAQALAEEPSGTAAVQQPRAVRVSLSSGGHLRGWLLERTGERIVLRTPEQRTWELRPSEVLLISPLAHREALLIEELASAALQKRAADAERAPREEARAQPEEAVESAPPPAPPTLHRRRFALHAGIFSGYPAEGASLSVSLRLTPYPIEAQAGVGTSIVMRTQYVRAGYSPAILDNRGADCRGLTLELPLLIGFAAGQGEYGPFYALDAQVQLVATGWMNRYVGVSWLLSVGGWLGSIQSEKASEMDFLKRPTIRAGMGFAF